MYIQDCHVHAQGSKQEEPGEQAREPGEASQRASQQHQAPNQPGASLLEPASLINLAYI